jgi:hypothetical protein
VRLRDLPARRPATTTAGPEAANAFGALRRRRVPIAIIGGVIALRLALLGLAIPTVRHLL